MIFVKINDKKRRKYWKTPNTRHVIDRYVVDRGGELFGCGSDIIFYNNENQTQSIFIKNIDIFYKNIIFFIKEIKYFNLYLI